MNVIYSFIFLINIKGHTFWIPVLCDVTRCTDVNRVAFPRVSWHVAVFTIAKKEIPACDWSGVQALALPVRSLHQRPGSPVHLSPATVERDHRSRGQDGPARSWRTCLLNT